MKKSVMFRDELVKKLNISEELMKELEKRKMVKPFGLTEEKIPFYTDEVIEQVNYIKKMVAMGYEMEEIQRIIKKIGFPKSVVPSPGVEQTGKHLTIGDLAGKVGVSARTLKHWEEKGIIEADMRSSGGFRLYSEIYIYLCKLIKDLQLFGYSLKQIKDISGHFRDFLVINKNIKIYSHEETSKKLDSMTGEILLLKERILLLKEGIGRWDDLINKKVKEISGLKKKNEKRVLADTKGKSKKEKVKSEKAKQPRPSAVSDSKDLKPKQVKSKKAKVKSDKSKGKK